MAIVALGASLLIATAVAEGRAWMPSWLLAAIRVGTALFMAWLLLAALLMSGLGCDDTCGNEGPWWEHRDAWQWQAQLWIVVVAVGIWVMSLRWAAHRRTLVLASIAVIAMWTVLLLPVDNAPV